MNKSILRMVMAATLMVALAAFIMPAGASGDPGAGCPAVTKHYDTINGSVYFEQQGYVDNSPMTKTFENVPDGIKIAKVYTGVWQGSPGKGGYFKITIRDSTGAVVHTTNEYRACDPCPNATNCLVDGHQCARCDALNDSASGNLANNTGAGFDLANMHDYIVGCGVQFISFNATPYIAHGTNTITVETEACADCYRGGWDGRIYLIALLVVYENDTMPEITYWVNEGALYLETGSDCDGPDDHSYASKYFNGTNVSNPTKVRLWSLGFPHVINGTNAAPQQGDANTTLNDNNIGCPDETEYYGTYPDESEVLLRWNNIPPGYVNNVSNLLEYYDPDAEYERAFAEVMIVQGPSDKPDLAVTDIEFPTMMRPNQDYTINATVENQGGNDTGAFNVSLGSYSAEVTVTKLGAGNNTTVSFTHVNLAAGCYDFKVTADCNGDVTEDNEFNNERTEKYQVGNVIVVNSNSDFASLDLATNIGGTYYIQNLDITNCAGYGISIANTNVCFVIRDCTVHDCSLTGVRFNNVTNGKVNDNEVRNNGRKGIKVVNSSYVTIENNSVHHNVEYGIDVYMDTMPTIDSHHVIISNNTIEHNLYGIELYGCNCTVNCNTILDTTSYGGGEEGYGIYVSGNYSKIHNNTIKNSDNYGIYVDNTWIATYWNLIYGNDFIGNNKLIPHSSQAFDNGTNYWNTPTEVYYYYDNDGTRYNYTGNYWSDYDGNLYAGNYDSNGDGIGDSPYAIDGEAGAADSYPRIVPWWVCGDVNGDGSAGIQDGKDAAGGHIITSRWAANVFECEVDVVNIQDGRKIAAGYKTCCPRCRDN